MKVNFISPILETYQAIRTTIFIAKVDKVPLKSVYPKSNVNNLP